jgi:hypothetical protein
MAGAGATADGIGAAVVVGPGVVVVVVGPAVVVVLVVVVLVVVVLVVVVLVVVVLVVVVLVVWHLRFAGGCLRKRGADAALQRRCNQTSGHQGVTNEASAAFQCTLPVGVGHLIARRRIQIIALAVLGHPASRGTDPDRRGWWRVRTARSS